MVFLKDNEGVTNCKTDLSRYFHPTDEQLKHRFKVLYELFKLNDDKLARKIGIDKSTMSRYRRGIFVPTRLMKLKIAQALTEVAGYPVDSAVVWGEDLIFDKWKEKESDDNVTTD